MRRARAHLRELVGRLLLTTGGVTFLIGLGGLVRASSISQGAPVWLPMSLVPLIVGQALPYFLPLALLTAVVFGYGRMAADGEHVAAFAAGAHPARLLLPAVLLGTLTASALHPFSSEVLPDLYRKMRELGARVRVAALENTRPGASELHHGGLHLLWNGRDEDGAFRDVLLQFRGASPDRELPLAVGELRVLADRARLRVEGERVVFSFEGLRAFSTTDEEAGWTVQNDGTTFLVLDLASVVANNLPEYRAKDLPTSELLRRLDRGELDPEQERSALHSIAQRRALSACLLPLGVIGALIGWRLRRGGFLAGLGAAMGLLVLVFYPAYYVGEALYESDAVEPRLAGWIPFLALLPLVALLSRGASRLR